MNHSRLQIFYSGKVQGVGFRYQARQLAAGFEITGEVRNLPDGRVELLIEGEATELQAYRQAIRESGLGPLIRQEQEIRGEATHGFTGFEIVSR